MRTREALPVLTLVTVHLPDDASILHLRRSPVSWEESRNWGDEWVRSLSSLSLPVPSAVVPQDRNFLLNPNHPDMARVTVISQDMFRFDPRLAAPNEI